MFDKSAHTSFFKKGVGKSALGIAKGTIRMLDDGMVQGVLSTIVPEVGVPVVVASKLGLLEKIKR